ncbi:MAG: T9SS type A sorting domain-containing protein [Flavobacteriales bacterium]|nr:T9SS type A sorting domain-containing protein [Flavobacteriales bacterium]
MNSNTSFQSLTGGDYHVFPDGRVLLSGSHTLSDTARGYVGQYNLIWFSNEGYLDTTRLHRQANGTIWQFKELPDGKFICTCSCSQYEGQPVSRLFRIHADGSLDTTFQSSVSSGNIYELEALPDGRVLVGGNFRFSENPSTTVHLARVLPDGSRDPAFANLTFVGNSAWWPTSGTIVFEVFPFHGGHHIIGGQFTAVNGQARKGLCMIDEHGELHNAFANGGVGPFTYQGTTNATPLSIAWNSDSTALYINGAYAGYDDGTTNDPQQRFVSRLLVSELTVGAEERLMPSLRVYPNPASTTATLELDVLPPHTQLVLRDALGREVLRQRVHAHTNVLNLQALPDGIYTLELREEHKRISVQRLAVRH